jgi:hypothetical protein
MVLQVIKWHRATGNEVIRTLEASERDISGIQDNVIIRDKYY